MKPNVYSCPKCHQRFYTETARDVHEENCNGGVEDDG